MLFPEGEGLGGLIELHSHLLPGVDDGSRSVEESLSMARTLVEHGYAQAACTPHVWPSLPGNTIAGIAPRVARLQAALDAAGIALRLHAGGEVSLLPELLEAKADSLPTYGSHGRTFLVDTWIGEWEAWLTPVIRHLQAGGRRVVLAHPERALFIQREPDHAQRLRDLGVLLQGNMYCLVDPEGSATRELSRRFLESGMYEALGGDLHRADTMEKRMRGLGQAFRLAGAEVAKRLLVEVPARLVDA